MCFDERKTPVNCITLFSIIVAICGVIMVAFSYLGTQSDTVQNLKEAKSMEDLNSSSKVMAVFFFGLSFFIIVVAVLGFCFRCCKNRCYAICYGVTIFPVWLLLIIFGGIAVGIALAGEDDMVKYCLELTEQTKKANEKAGDVIPFDLNIYDQIMIDTYMCDANNCPCDISGKDKGWNALT